MGNSDSYKANWPTKSGNSSCQKAGYDYDVDPRPFDVESHALGIGFSEQKCIEGFRQKKTQHPSQPDDKGKNAELIIGYASQASECPKNVFLNLLRVAEVLPDTYDGYGNVCYHNAHNEHDHIVANLE